MPQVSEPIPFDPESLVRELSKRGLAWADAESAYRALDDATKSVFGQAYLQTDGTVAEREARARNIVGYLNHVEAVAKARKSALVARVNWDCWSEYLRLKQTQESTERAKIGLR